MNSLSQSSFNTGASDGGCGGYSEGLGGLADPGRKFHYRVAFDENELLREVRHCESTRSEALLHLLERYEPVAFHISNLLVEDPAQAATASEDACVESVSRMLESTPMDSSEFRVLFFRNLHRHCKRVSSVNSVQSDSKQASLRSAIRKLPDSCRWVSLLKFIGGLTDREIAGVLSISTSDARSLLTESMQELLGRRSGDSSQPAKITGNSPVSSDDLST